MSAELVVRRTMRTTRQGVMMNETCTVCGGENWEVAEDENGAPIYECASVMIFGSHRKPMVTQC